MNVKTDTKEKFTVITPEETSFTVNLADELSALLLPYLQKDIPHLIVKLTNVQSIDAKAAEKLATLQQDFYANNCSLVICEMSNPVKEVFNQAELTDVMNITPTESEAWDILQMEEIERELLGGEDE